MKSSNIYGDNVGYVEIIDVMGHQFTPAEDARTSTGRGSLGDDKDAQLQRRLMNDNHTSPFEGVVVKIEMMVPLFVLREIDRHRTTTKVSDLDGEELVTPEENGRKWFARNEMSGRYIQMPDLYYHPQRVRTQSKTNKQGGDIAPDQLMHDEFINRGKVLTGMARELYDWAVINGIERGMARIYNTQNQYTRIRLTGSLKNWCDFLALRLPNGVLWECRRVAEEIERLLAEQFPAVMKQWRESRYETVVLNRTEREELLKFLAGGNGDTKVLQGIDRKLRGE